MPIPTASRPAGISPARPPTYARPVVPAGPPPEILPLSQVRAGMVGTAYTVFSGTKVEPFAVRVISIVENFVPKQDVILVKAEDPRVEFSGIAAGMSGSPVYIDGKLIGAIAYAWSFSKTPLAGVTPIETMLAERKRPRRVSDERLAEVGGLPAGFGNGVSMVAAPTSDPAAPGEPRLQAVAVPLSVSGLSMAAMHELAEDLKPFGLVPMRAGGGGGRRVPSGEPGRIEPGSAVGVPH